MSTYVISNFIHSMWTLACYLAEDTESVRYLGFWSTRKGDMSKTKEKVFEVAREAKELIRLHPFTFTRVCNRGVPLLHTRVCNRGVPKQRGRTV